MIVYNISVYVYHFTVYKIYPMYFDVSSRVVYEHLSKLLSWLLRRPGTCCHGYRVPQVIVVMVTASPWWQPGSLTNIILVFHSNHSS